MKIDNQAYRFIFHPKRGKIVVTRDSATKKSRNLSIMSGFYCQRLKLVQNLYPISNEMESHNRRLIHHLTLTILLIGLWVNGFCQQTDSLMFYLEMAAKNNPTILQRYAEYEAAMQKVPQVGSLPDPELSLGVFLSPMELVAGKQIADIQLMQMFPWFGVLRNAKNEMSLMAKAKFEIYLDAKLQLYFDVQRTWYELNKLEQNIQITEQNLELLRTIERLSVVRLKAGPSGNGLVGAGNPMPSASASSAVSASSGMEGMGGSNASAPTSSATSVPMGGNAMGSAIGGSMLSDVYRIQIEIIELLNSIELLKSQRTTFSAQFNSFLNRSHSAQVSLPDSFKSEDIGPDLLTITDSSLKSNPMLEMLRYEQQSLESRKQMAAKMSYPMIGIGLNYSLIGRSEMSTSPMNGSDMAMPMVTVTLPINRKKYKAIQAEVEFEKIAIKRNYQSTANSLLTEYYQAIQLYYDSERRMKLYSEQNQLASQSLEILLKSYSASGSDLTSILRVQQQQLDYRLKHMGAVADYNTSIAWIKRLLVYSQIQ